MFVSLVCLYVDFFCFASVIVACFSVKKNILFSWNSVMDWLSNRCRYTVQHQSLTVCSLVFGLWQYIRHQWQQHDSTAFFFFCIVVAASAILLHNIFNYTTFRTVEIAILLLFVRLHCPCTRSMATHTHTHTRHTATLTDSFPYDVKAIAICNNHRIDDASGQCNRDHLILHRCIVYVFGKTARAH